MLNKNKLMIFPKDQDYYHNLIKEAKLELLISRQALPNIDFCNLLIRARDKRVDIKLLLSDPEYFRTRSVEEISKQHKINLDMASYSKITLVEKEELIKYLQSNEIYPRYINHNKFFLNHSKFMIIDSEIIFIGSAPNDHTTRLDIGILSRNNEYIKTFQSLFQADFNNRDFIKKVSGEITIAPYNLREVIENLLRSAEESIYLMFPVITDDPRILHILKTKRAQNIKINILCSPDIFITCEENIDIKYNNELTSYGANLKESYQPIIHNRSIIIDPENKKGLKPKVYIGSGNLKTSSLDSSRETGLVLNDPDIISQLFELFHTLWSKIN